MLGLLQNTRPPEGFKGILDVGCGTGVLFDSLQELGSPVQGVEMDPALVRASSHAEDIHVGPFDTTFCPGRRFALVLMLDVLEHLERPREALQQTASLLLPNGRLVLTVPAFNALWTSHDVHNRHQTRFTRGSLHPLLQEAGFQVELSRYLFQSLAAAKILLGLKERIHGRSNGVAQVPPKPIGSLLYAVCRAEHALLRFIPLPFGSTLLVSARLDSASPQE